MQATAAVQMATEMPDPTGSALPQGAAQVSALVAASGETVWAALTQRDAVGQWFGNLSETLKPGGSYRLDFGDGDFFEIDDVAIEPPQRLSYRWRFLGTGPVDAIVWSIERLQDHCRVTVTDSEPNRSPAGIAEMIEGWTDFLQRLQRYCGTGENARYAWRKEFGGSIELAVDAAAACERLLSAEGQRRWLPWSGQAVAPGASVTVHDDGKPSQFVIGAVESTGKFGLRFALTCSGWRAPTPCSIEIRDWPHGALLIVTHTGWETISGLNSEQAQQRLRFGTLWTRSLHTAQVLASRRR